MVSFFPRGLKNRARPGGGRPDRDLSFILKYCLSDRLGALLEASRLRGAPGRRPECCPGRASEPYERLSGRGKTTLSGGSLGSCVDEERSQLRELM